jgi:hypothetical protein
MYSGLAVDIYYIFILYIYICMYNIYYIYYITEYFRKAIFLYFDPVFAKINFCVKQIFEIGPFGHIFLKMGHVFGI